MVLDSGSGSGILNREYSMEVPWDCLRVTSSRPSGTLSLESQPRTASWAKFSRPCGTRFRDGRSHADSLSPAPFFAMRDPFRYLPECTLRCTTCFPITTQSQSIPLPGSCEAMAIPFSTRIPVEVTKSSCGMYSK